MTTSDLHPLAALLPEMPEGDYKRLKEDIAQHGVRLPVVTLGGKILDGRHRARACRELGIDYPTIEATGDPAAIVAGLNLHRRHLAPDQVVAIAELLKDAITTATPEPEPHVRPEPRRVGKESVETAKALGVGRATVERVREVKRKAPERLPEIAAGKMKAVAVLREHKEPTAASAVRVDLPQRALDILEGRREASQPAEFTRTVRRLQRTEQQIQRVTRRLAALKRQAREDRGRLETWTTVVAS